MFAGGKGIRLQGREDRGHAGIPPDLSRHLRVVLPCTANADAPTAIGDPMTVTHAVPASLLAPAGTNLTVLRRVGSTIARLHGNLDITTSPAVRERLRDLLSACAKLLVIDLSEVPWSDAAGLAVLIGTQRRARSRGITVRLAAPSPLVAEGLRVTGLDSSLTICDTLADALPPRLHDPRAAISPKAA
jgi:anti-anti-sigma factor